MSVSFEAHGPTPVRMHVLYIFDQAWCPVPSNPMIKTTRKVLEVAVFRMNGALPGAGSGGGRWGNAVWQLANFCFSTFSSDSLAEEAARKRRRRKGRVEERFMMWHAMMMFREPLAFRPSDPDQVKETIFS